ncbi:MAG TPA: hypothetical protein VJQ56_11135 [Blastocatellia bacterium]|nr:hypothetical protein [Blastocatellia bacterium]
MFNLKGKLFIAVVVFFGFSGLAGGAYAQDDRRFIDLSSVPTEADSTKAFAPKGWVVEEEITGDLNGDSRPDVVVKLIEDRPAENKEGQPLERYRALLVLLRTEGGKLWRAAAADRLLMCTTCGGMLSDPSGANVQVEITKGVIVIDQLRGSREAVNTTLRFRHDHKLNRFLLIGEDVELRDRATGETTRRSSNFLTGVKLTEKYRYDERRDKEVLISKNRQRLTGRVRFIEEIDFDRY